MKINKAFWLQFKRGLGLQTKGSWWSLHWWQQGGHMEQEEGHQWAETLTSVKVPKVKQESVKFTPVFPFRAQVKWQSYVRVGSLRHRQFPLSELWRGISATVIATCCRAMVVFLFKHIGCILYMLTFPSVPHVSAYRASHRLTALCDSRLSCLVCRPSTHPSDNW